MSRPTRLNVRTGTADLSAAIASFAAGEDTRSRSYPTSSSAVTSGTIYLSYFTAAKSEVITKLAAYVEGTAGAGLTQAQMGLYAVDALGNLTLVASTAAGDTTGFTTTFAQAQKSLSASYTKVVGQRYAFAVLFTGTTMPALVCHNGSAALAAQPPRMSGAVASQTALPASLTAAQVTNDLRAFYGVLTP